MLAEFILLIILFLILGKFADITVRGIKVLSRHLGIPALVSGFILGFFTSAPEFFIGINSSLKDINTISFGNLLGGVLVLLGLVSSLNIILNKKVDVRHGLNTKEFISIALFLIYPLLAMLNGKVTLPEGLFMIMVFLGMSYYFFKGRFEKNHFRMKMILPEKKVFFHIVFGLTGIIVISKFIVDLSFRVVESYQLPIFLFGLIIFSLGTNLPELIITIKSWQNKIKDFALGNIIGSAVTNIFIVGILTLFRPIVMEITFPFYNFLFFYILICALFMIMALTDQRFNQQEGLWLLGIYIIFLASQMLFKF